MLRRSAPWLGKKLKQRLSINAQQCASPTSLRFSGGCVVALFAANDLRVHDNYVLTFALRKCLERNVPLVAVLCLDTRTFAQPSRLGHFFRQSPRRATFHLQCVTALRSELERRGVPLLVRTGFPEDEVPSLCQKLNCVALFQTTQYAPHEEAVHNKIAAKLKATTATIVIEQSARKKKQSPYSKKKRRRGGNDAVEQRVEVHSVWQSTLVNVEDLPTPVERMKEGLRWYHDDLCVATIRPTAPYNCDDGCLEAKLAPLLNLQYSRKAALLLPTLRERDGNDQPNEIRGHVPTLKDLGYGNDTESGGVDLLSSAPTLVMSNDYWHVGGEREALAHVDKWLELDGLHSFVKLGRTKRTTMSLHSKRLSRVSPFLATGCLSVRTLYERTRSVATDSVMKGSSQVQFNEFLLRLARRDFWHFVGLHYGKSLFFSYGPRPENTDDVADWRRDEKIVRKWCAGLTGIPFADAAMRELVSTGFLPDAGRRALAWLLSKGYGQDWRFGAEWFERCSLDYDPFLTYGNFAYAIGLIKDDFGDATFPTLHIAHQFDAMGIYTKRWLPELSKVPALYIHRVHVMSDRMQKMHNVTLGKTYPLPLKLWDGAAATLGAAELTTYFDDSKKPTALGWNEADAFGSRVLPPELRHAAVAHNEGRKQTEVLISKEPQQQIEV